MSWTIRHVYLILIAHKKRLYNSFKFYCCLMGEHERYFK